jgi:hypothetical protein
MTKSWFLAEARSLHLQICNGRERKGKTFSGKKIINLLISRYGQTLTSNNQHQTVFAQLESTECCIIVVLNQAIPAAISIGRLNSCSEEQK